MADISLTSAMRANLNSMQSTNSLLELTQNRLSTGKKVGSAVDNPNSYFTAQSLTARAADIGARLDGMGQAQQTINAATQAMTSVSKLLDQMTAVATAAKASMSTATSTPSPYTQTHDVVGFLAGQADGYLINKDPTAGATASGLGVIVSTDTLVMTIGGASTTLTVHDTIAIGDTGANNTIEKLVESINSSNIGLTASLVTDAGSTKTQLKIISNTGADVDFSGKLAGKLGLSDIGTTQTLTTNSTNGTITSATLLTAGVTLGMGTAITSADVLTVQVGGRAAVSYSKTATGAGWGQIGAGGSIGDVVSWLNSQSGLQASLVTDSGGKQQIKLVNTEGSSVKFTGNAAQQLGFSENLATVVVAMAGNSHTSNISGAGNTGFASAAELQATALVTAASVSTAITTADILTMKVGNGATLSFSATTVTKQADLLTFLNSQSTLGVTASFVTVAGVTQLDVKSASGATVTFGGSMAVSDKLNMTDITAATASGTGPAKYDAGGTYTKQFNDLIGQVQNVVADSSYKGVNLLAKGNDLNVAFNEDGSSSLTVKALDYSKTGNHLNYTGAASNGDVDFVTNGVTDITKAITALKEAQATVRTDTRIFGTNLAVIQTRQDFAKGMIQTLNTGADKLTLADMSEEGANMLALQTRSQLGIQSLSMASQNAQSVLQLFR